MVARKTRPASGIFKFVHEDPDDRGARHRLIESCQGLVRSLAWKIHRKLPSRVELDDLIAFGQVGLAEAARDFDPGKGPKFSTYAHYRIRGAVFDGLTKMNWFSRHQYHASRYEHMADEVIRMGSEDESGVDQLDNNLCWFKDAASTLAVVYLATDSQDEASNAAPQLADDSAPSPSAEASRMEISTTLRELIDALPSDSGSLLRGVYFEGLTLAKAGERIGISKAWASRLHAKTLRRLAHSLRLLGIVDSAD